MQRTLIIARMDPADAPRVADVFAESDAGELPHLLGVTERRLYLFNGLYAHLVSTRDDLPPSLDAVRESAPFTDVNRKLAAYISAYDPATWRGPRDAMATEFYTWTAPQRVGVPR